MKTLIVILMIATCSAMAQDSLDASGGGTGRTITFPDVTTFYFTTKQLKSHDDEVIRSFLRRVFARAAKDPDWKNSKTLAFVTALEAETP